MSVADRIVITVTVERRLTLDGVDSMSKIIIQETIPAGEEKETIDKIRELLAQAEQNPFTFL